MKTPAGPIQVGQHMTGRVKRATLSAVVTRADGTVEDLGVIAETTFPRPNLFRAFLARIGIL